MNRWIERHCSGKQAQSNIGTTTTADYRIERQLDRLLSGTRSTQTGVLPRAIQQILDELTFPTGELVPLMVAEDITHSNQRNTSNPILDMSIGPIVAFVVTFLWTVFWACWNYAQEGDV